MEKQNNQNQYYLMDKTDVPYEDGQNPFIDTEVDKKFYQEMIERLEHE